MLQKLKNYFQTFEKFVQNFRKKIARTAKLLKNGAKLVKLLKIKHRPPKTAKYYKTTLKEFLVDCYIENNYIS